VKSQRKSSSRSKEMRQTEDRIASIMTDHPKLDTSKIDSKGIKMRPITSDTKRPMTQKTSKRKPRPVSNYL